MVKTQLLFSVPRRVNPQKDSMELTRQTVDKDSSCRFCDSTCRFCGLQNDQNVALTMENNQVLYADLFCASCVEIQRVKRGEILYLPEVEKEDFHHLVRTVYLAMVLGGPEEQEEAEEILEQLLELAVPVEKVWGTSKAKDFSELLQTATDDSYQKRGQVLDGLQLLVHPACLPKNTVGSWVRQLREKGRGSLGAWKCIFEAHFSPT